MLTTLALAGGNALGAYAAGAVESMDTAGVVPDVLHGVSIGAINAVIIAGNAHESRVDRLRGFWRRSTVGSVRGASLDSGVRRAQDLCFGSQTRRAIETQRAIRRWRHLLAQSRSDATPPGRLDMIKVAYRSRNESGGKALEFSAASMDERWSRGRDDMDRAIAAFRAGEATTSDPGFRLYAPLPDDALQAPKARTGRERRLRVPSIPTTKESNEPTRTTARSAGP